MDSEHAPASLEDTKKPWGLFLVHGPTIVRPPTDPTVDVVAIHGIRGHRARSFTASDSGAFWLRDFLPYDIPSANVFTYGYPDGKSIDSTARDLIQSLDNARIGRSKFETPIIFVAHSSGGLIVKQALILLATYRAQSTTRILSNTKSLLFFGVYHRGISSSLLSYLNFAARMIRFVSPGWPGGFGGDLFPSPEVFQNLLEGFAPISNRFQIYTFVESITFHGQHLVSDRNTYYLGLPNEELNHANATHMDLVRFSGRDADYQKVIAILRRGVMVADVPSAGSTDWQTDQLFRLGGLESESAKQWFNDLRSDAHRVVDSRPQIGRRTRVAVLDSGIDWSHPCFQDAIAESRIVAKSFLQQGIPGDVDSNGHGTHTAHLVLKTTPHSKLFIARVYEHGTEEEFDNNISSVVQAIKWATEQNVDIITMSLGYRCENASIKAALRDAFHKGIILFAAASNSGVNPRFPISFPANIRQVICIHSSDGDGNPSLRNPPSTHDCNLAILGEGVAAAWPQDLFTEREDKLRVASGSSVATPIAAGLAALIIEYASQGGSALEIVTKWKRLKHCDEIRKLFQSMTRERAGYLSIAPSSLFDYHGEDMHQRVCGRIADILDSL